MFRNHLHSITLLSILLCLLLQANSSAQETENNELEKQVQTIVNQLKDYDPALLDCGDPAALDLIKKLENIGPEARAALPLLEKFASMDNPVGYRMTAIEYSVRALENMGGEGTPTLKKLLKTSRGETLYWTLGEMKNSTYLDYSPFLPELEIIANRDESPPNQKVIQGEIAAFQAMNPTVDLNSGFANTSGSKSLDDFKMLEQQASMAMNIILNSQEARALATNIFVKRMTRQKNPSFFGIDRYVGNSEIIAALKTVVLTTNDPDRKLSAASHLSKIDPAGKTAIPILLSMLAEKSYSDSEIVRQITLQIKQHPALNSYDRAALLSAIEKAPESERENIQQQLVASKSDIAKQRKRLNEQFQKLNKGDKRTALEVAGRLIRIEPDNKEAINYMLEIVDDTSLPSTIRDAGGFGRGPGKFHLRPIAARELVFASKEHHKRILESLKESMLERTGSPGYSRLTDLAKIAAWSAAQLDRKDASLVQFASSRNLPFSSSNTKSPFYGESGKFVAEVFGDRLDPFAEKLVIKSLQYDRGSGDAYFSRQILFNAKTKETDGKAKSENPYIKMLVERAFKKIAGEIVDTKRTIVSENNDRAISINFLIDNCDRLHPAFETILEYTRSPNFNARKTAVSLLGKMKHNPETSVKALIASCNDERALVRLYAAQALTKFGAAAKPALPKLRSMKSDRYESVKAAAQKAILAIER